MTDVLIVSLGSTVGLRIADEELRDALERAGATVELVRATRPREVRTLALTDLLWARAARRAANGALTRSQPRAVIYSTITAALLWPRPGAIYFDVPAAANRRGRHGLWQRPLECPRLRAAPLLVAQSEGGLRALPAAAHAEGRTLVLPVPIAASGTQSPGRDIAAITYAANPAVKGLERVLDAWRQAGLSGEELVIAGCDAEQMAHAGISLPEHGVRLVGSLEPGEYRALLRRSRVFVCAPSREGYGIAQLEALADGCMLVTSSAEGPYVAFDLARTLDRRLVGPDLAVALRIALDDPLPDYREQAAALLEPFGHAAVDRIVAEQLLPRLLNNGRA